MRSVKLGQLTSLPVLRLNRNLRENRSLMSQVIDGSATNQGGTPGVRDGRVFD